VGTSVKYSPYLSRVGVLGKGEKFFSDVSEKAELCPDDYGIPLWYAIQTRSRHEKLVRDRLAWLKIEPLLPTVTRLSVLSTLPY